MSAWPRTEMLRRCKTAREPDGASPRTLPPAIRAPAAILAARADRGRSSWPRLVCRNKCGGRALGPDHPTTLVSAVALTLALVDLGEPEQARWLGQDTVEWCRRMLGPDHPTTLLVAQIAGVSHSPGRRRSGRRSCDLATGEVRACRGRRPGRQSVL